MAKFIDPFEFNKRMQEEQKHYFTMGARGGGRTAALEERMIKVEGYKAFRGCMRVTVCLPSGKAHAFVSGDWLYKPHTDCWYCGGGSYPSEICQPWGIE